MGIGLIPSSLRSRYRFDEREHAVAILARDFPIEFADICDCLDQFVLKRSDISAPGGGKSRISQAIDNFFRNRGWSETSFDIKISADGVHIPIPTHKIDNFINRVGIEVEWNNKDPFYDRDLNNFRLLRELHVLSVGVMITRLTELNQLFKKLGPSTTHWDKLIPRVDGGGAGGCPLLLIGLGLACYDATL